MSYFTWAFGIWTTAVVFVSFKTYSFSGENIGMCAVKGERKSKGMSAPSIQVGDSNTAVQNKCLEPSNGFIALLDVQISSFIRTGLSCNRNLSEFLQPVDLSTFSSAATWRLSYLQRVRF